MARKATWQSRASPCGSLGGTSGRIHVAGATRVHADARVVPRGMRGAGRWRRAHGLVGPGNSIGAVTQKR